MIYIGSDHRGYSLKEILKTYLTELGFPYEDLGAKELIPDDDYPDYALPVAKKVSESPTENFGILICGSGVGVDIVANKIKGVRSALCFNVDQAKASRNDDNSNVLSLSSDFISEDLAEDIVKIWLATPFSGEERHIRRLEKINTIDVGHQ
jgi:ribose 5-phosphate isomerase B